MLTNDALAIVVENLHEMIRASQQDTYQTYLAQVCLKVIKNNGPVSPP